MLAVVPEVLADAKAQEARNASVTTKTTPQKPWWKLWWGRTA